MDWSRDGRYIVEQVVDPKAHTHLWVLPLVGDRKAFPYLRTESIEQWGQVSPNGRWLAYASDESKRFEVYVQTFPNPGSKSQVSIDGGALPVWSRDGKELYFMAPDGKMMAAAVKGAAMNDSARFELGPAYHIGGTIRPGASRRFETPPAELLSQIAATRSHLQLAAFGRFSSCPTEASGSANT